MARLAARLVFWAGWLVGGWRRWVLVAALLAAMVPGSVSAAPASSRVVVSAFRTCQSVETRIEVSRPASGVVVVAGRSRAWTLRRPGRVEVSIPLHHSRPAADAVVVGSFKGQRRLFVRTSEYGFGEPCPRAG